MDTDIKIKSDSDEVLLLKLFWKIESKNDEIAELKDEIAELKQLLSPPVESEQSDLCRCVGSMCKPEGSL